MRRYPALILFLLLYGCGSGGVSDDSSVSAASETLSDRADSGLLVFDIEKSLSEKEAPDTMFLWNALSRRVRYVPLETSDSSVLYGQVTVHPYGSDMFVESRKQMFFSTFGLYDSTGRFKRNFLKLGHGPYELVCLLPRGVIPNIGDSTVFLRDPGHKRVVRYDFQGRGLNEFRLPEYMSWMILLDSTKLLVRNLYEFRNTSEFDNVDYKLSVIDRDGKLLKGYFPVGDRKFGNLLKGGGTPWVGVFFPSFYRYSNYTHVFYLCSDTVYRVTADTLSPRLVLRLGKYRLDDSRVITDVGFSEPYIQSMSVREFRDYVYLVYDLGQKAHYDIWDKRTQRLLARTVTSSESSAPHSFLLELPSGHRLRTDPVGLGDNRIVFALPATNDEVLRAFPNVKEDDNPVLAILDL